MEIGRAPLIVDISFYDSKLVIPAEAGIQDSLFLLDSRFRGNDGYCIKCICQQLKGHYLEIPIFIIVQRENLSLSGFL